MDDIINILKKHGIDGTWCESIRDNGMYYAFIDDSDTVRMGCSIHTYNVLVTVQFAKGYDDVANEVKKELDTLHAADANYTSEFMEDK